jgi:GT2 family glycosyltransferase
MGIDFLLDLSIIIVNWNTSGLLCQCLNSIYSSGSKFSFEVIVVDNGSGDDSVSMVETNFPSVTLIKNWQNLGFAHGNNQGLSIAKGKYFMLLNSDTIVLPNAFDMLIQIADEHPELGAIGPQILNLDGTIQESWASFPSILSELLGRNFRVRKLVGNTPYAYDVDWIMGACMLVRATTVADVGTLDDDYFFYAEEMDWCYRIKKNNWKIWYITNAQIYHLGGGSSHRSSLPQLCLLYKGKLLYFQKHHGKWKTVLLRYGFAIGNALGIVRRIILFNWMNSKTALQRIMDQSRLVWYLLWDRYPNLAASPSADKAS